MPKDSNLAVVLVTGPAVGIGQVLAHLLVKDRYQLILVDQNAEGLRCFADHLRAQHGTPINLITQDLVHVGAAQATYQAVQAQGLQVDILVNDVGFGEYGIFFDFSIKRNSLRITGP